MELQLKDLETVQARATKMERAAQTGDKDAAKSYGFYEKVLAALESGNPPGG